MDGTVKIKLTGFPEDVQAIATFVHQHLEVLEESPSFQTSGFQLVKRYLTVRQK